MPKTRPSYEDEIDLIELFFTLCEGKWKIIMFIIVAVLFSSALYFILPNSYKATTPISVAKASTFFPYTSLNEVLERNGFSLSLGRENMFDLFIEEFNDFEEIIDVISQDEYVKQSLEGLNNNERQRAIIELARSFNLKLAKKDNLLSKNVGELSIEWHNDLEGLRLLDDAIKQMLINMQMGIKNDLNELANAIESRNKVKLQNLELKLTLIKENKAFNDAKQLVFLREESEIAKELKIETNQLDVSKLSQKPTKAGILFNINADTSVPYYLRGYKAIDKEIEQLENRSTDTGLLMEPGYIDTLAEITSVKLDASVSQLKLASEVVVNDNPNSWVEYDIRLSDSKSQKKIVLFVALGIVLGGIIGGIYVLISEALLKRKKKFRKV